MSIFWARFDTYSPKNLALFGPFWPGPVFWKASFGPAWPGPIFRGIFLAQPGPARAGKFSARHKPIYDINRQYPISNTPVTKFMKFGKKCSILHFKMIYMKSEMHMSLFLNPYRKIMSIKPIFGSMKWIQKTLLLLLYWTMYESIN